MATAVTPAIRSLHPTDTAAGVIERYDGQWHVERKVVEAGDTKTAARQEGVPLIPYLQKITDKYWKSVGCPAEGAAFGRWMNNLKRDHITPQLKKEGMNWNGWHAFHRGLATNLHEMGVPTKVIQRICRHADEATTKKHYVHATEPGVRSGMRKLEASITREKHKRRQKSSSQVIDCKGCRRSSVGRAADS